MFTVTKQFSFCYGHRLPGYEGKCVQQHGHNSILEVEVRGFNGPNTPTGMIIDFNELKKEVNGLIINVLDHRNLNDLELEPPVPGRSDVEWNEMIQMPTAERMLKWIVAVLQWRFGNNLVRVRLSETPTSWAEWKMS